MDGRRRGWIAGSAILGTLSVFVASSLAAVPPESRESWDAVFIAGKKVGYIQTIVEPVQAKDGRELLRVQVQTQLRFKRLNDTVTMQTRYGTIETLEGAVLRLDARTLVGPNEMRISGDVKDAKMDLALEGGGQRQSLLLDWGDDVRGPYGPEQSMSRTLLKPGEERVVKTFIPDLNQIGSTALAARAVEQVELGGGVQMGLLRVDSKVTGPDGKPLPGMDSTYWVDEGGQILKTQTDVFGGLTTYRTTRDAALAPIKTPFDLVKASIVSVGRKINRPEETRYALFKVNVKGEDPTKLFPTDARQSVRKAADGTYLLEVRTLGPKDGTADPAEVDPAYLRPNPLINSEDPKVLELTRKAMGPSDDPWTRAVSISTWVSQNLKNKNFSVSFATAKDVARDLSGDCSEHSVLTAAMLRAAGIPARVAIGLVYAEHLGGFGYHMWNDVHVNGRWVALDSTFGQSEVDALHLALSESSLGGVSPYGEFLEVVRVFDKLALEPVEIR